jgi:hypothetical protein
VKKGSLVLNTILVISLISIVISVNESYAQEAPEDTFLSNIIIIPETRTAETSQATNEPVISMIILTSNEERIVLPTAQANKAKQSPFEQVHAGIYDIGIVIPEGFMIDDAKCAYQKADGKMIPIGEWDKQNMMINSINLAPQTAHKCTWILKQQNTLSEEIPTATAEVQKLLTIKGDSAGANAVYKIVVSGTITPGPNADANDKLSTNKNTVDGIVWITGIDDFYFTGDIVSITADHHIFSFVDGVEIPNGSTS